MQVIIFIVLSTLFAKIVSLLVGKGYGFSWPVSFVGGLIGAWLGTVALGSFGFSWMSYYFVPSLLGIAVVMTIFKIIDHVLFD